MSCRDRAGADGLSRYILRTDPAWPEVAGQRLPETWWSRPYEYRWAGSFTAPRVQVLDAGCGLEHPFKWHLGATCGAVVAVDSDPSIGTVRPPIGAPTGSVVLRQGDITRLPSPDGSFDRIFCLSVLDHLHVEQSVAALREFRRMLAPGGLLLLTVDVPPCDPETLLGCAGEAGLQPVGRVDFDVPNNVLLQPGPEQRAVFRTALSASTAGCRLTAGFLVRNEAHRYLEAALQHARTYADRIVVLDDASTDETPEICARYADVLEIRESSGFHQEWQVRRELWNLMLSTCPDWLLVLDADEILEGMSGRSRALLRGLDLAGANSCGVPLYDLWDAPDTYRDDAQWTAHHRLHPVLVRHRAECLYRWREADQHCGRIPVDALDGWGLRASTRTLRVLHYGWMSPQDRAAKAARYARLDPQSRWGNAQHYASILDPHPTLRTLPALRGVTE
jgi:SAM-dependent methyltransferase